MATDEDRTRPRLNDKALAALVVKRGLAQLTDIQEAIRLQLLSRKCFGVEHSLGMVLFLRGVLSASDLSKLIAEIELVNTGALRAQLSIGEVLIQLKHLKPEQLFHALDIQAARRREGLTHLLGEILLELGYIDHKQLEEGLQLLYDLNLRKLKQPDNPA